jgi:hypothetical protein
VSIDPTIEKTFIVAQKNWAVPKTFGCQLLIIILWGQKISIIDSDNQKFFVSITTSFM